MPHLYWGLGGEAGLSALKPTAPESSTFEAANIGAFIVIGLAGFLGFALMRWAELQPLRAGVLAACGIGAAVSFSHGFYGILFRVSQVGGLTEVDGGGFNREEHGWVLWDLLVIEPWFLVEGLLLALVGYHGLNSWKAKRSWLIGVGILTSVALISAASSVKVG